MGLLVICGSWHLPPSGRHALIICSCLILQNCTAALQPSPKRKKSRRPLHIVKDCAEEHLLLRQRSSNSSQPRVQQKQNIFQKRAVEGIFDWEKKLTSLPALDEKDKVKTGRRHFFLPFPLPLSLFIPHSISFSCVAYLDFGCWRHRRHKSRSYWCGYELRCNRDDWARSFPSVFPLQRWALDTVHFTCHFPAIHSF